MSNILTAIYNIYTLRNLEVEELSFGNNRATNVGDGLEDFIKDCFSSSFGDLSEQQRIDNYSNVFSYEGSATRPPDLMLRGGDAIEVKKTESIQADLQLNSSHPKSKLLSTSSLINKHCKECEDWDEKDLIYTIGHIPKKSKTLSSLWMVYGSIYAADEVVYTSLKKSVTDSLESAEGVNFSPTNELGRVNYVDPLKITNMRVRGMWLLQPPIKVYQYLYEYCEDLAFQLIAIIPTEKYHEFSLESRNLIEDNLDDVLQIDNVKVKNPNNTVALIDAKLITIKLAKPSV